MLYLSKLWKTLINKFFSTFALMFLIATPSFGEGVAIKNYGHSSLLITGGGRKILLNPFKAVACAEGLLEPKLKADIILASSELADEGARLSEGTFFVDPGSYQVGDFSFEGFQVPHDRMGGRRFGQATLWTWKQGGLKFAHLGGSASPLSFEDKLLIGRPDVLIIAVGGGAKVYNGQEAALVVQELNPQVVIPVQYVRNKIIPTSCDQTGIEPFLEAVKEIPLKKVGNKFSLTKDIARQKTIYIME